VSKSDDRIIKDPVHGYISVPRKICSAFVDSAIFQRLRNIEQTSMRWLFPGGRHDRFIHSLGVYHLARRIIDSVCENSDDEEVLTVLNNGKLRSTFEIAALMHDCGHSPFSHTFEDLYDTYIDGVVHDDAYKALESVVDDEMRKDLLARKKSGKPPASHEIMSAYVLLVSFSQELGDNDVDCPVLAARMITGCIHPKPKSIREQVENVLIKLLNGYVVDVDKLDYIIRDTWASGVNNFSIDVQRLITGAKITRVSKGADRIEFVYLPRSLGVIQTVIDARNHLYEWIYGHRVVVYYAEVLKRAVNDLGVALSNVGVPDPVLNSPREIIRRIFSKEMFADRVCCIAGLHSPTIERLSDGDLVFLLKEFCAGSQWWRIYSSHTPGHVAVWKTGAEYRSVITNSYRISMDNCVEAIRFKFNFSDDDCFACKDMAYKLQQISDDSVMIEMAPGKIRALPRLVALPRYTKVDGAVDNAAFYVYIRNEHEHLRGEIIEFVNYMSNMEAIEQTAVILSLRSQLARTVDPCPGDGACVQGDSSSNHVRETKVMAKESE